MKTSNEGGITLNDNTFDADPLGLISVGVPSNPIVDIIFVPPTGKTSLKSWTWPKSNDFWPEWLAIDEEFSRARIWTFGYEAYVDEQTGIDLKDFINVNTEDLLFKMKYEVFGNSAIGTLPIIFVAHSLGGLIVKRTLCAARSQPEFSYIVDQVKSIVFFSTPHRETLSDGWLNIYLKTLGFTFPENDDLIDNCGVIDEVQKDFLDVLTDLRLFSVIETHKTDGEMVMDKHNGFMNHKQEIRRRFPTDHHTVCKFKNAGDSRYNDIRNILLEQVLKFKPGLMNDISSSGSVDDEMKRLAVALGLDISAFDEDSMNFFLNHSAINVSSCNWITRKLEFKEWLDQKNQISKQLQVLHIYGPAGCGKSVLAAFIIDKVRSDYGIKSCQSHYFLYSEKPKRSIAYLLRSLAYQIAKSFSTFRAQLLNIIDSSPNLLESSSSFFLWEKVFSGALFGKYVGKTLHWIIDGLDEAEIDAASTLLDYLGRLKSSTALKVLLLGRNRLKNFENTSSTTNSFNLVEYEIGRTQITNNITAYVQSQLQHNIPARVLKKHRIIEEVIERAESSFLWASVVTKRLKAGWITETKITTSITEFPNSMMPIYQHMLEKIQLEKDGYRKRLANYCLIWATHSTRPLTLQELQNALSLEFEGLTGISEMVNELCNDFIHPIVDSKNKTNRLRLIHSTAREYLTKRLPDLDQFEILKPPNAHEILAESCLRYLSNKQWKHMLLEIENERHYDSPTSRISTMNIFDSFLLYAADSWAFHLALSTPGSISLLRILSDFLDKDVLTWIHTLALACNLTALTKTAQYIRSYVKNCRGQLPFLDIKSQDMLQTLGLWAIDFIKIPGKFGTNLIDKPSVIYKLIAPFCPSESLMAKTSPVRPGQDNLSVISPSNANWDDCQARLSLGTELYGAKIVASSEIIGVLVPKEVIVIWNADTFEEKHRLKHHDYVTHIALHHSNMFLCSAGYKRLQIWDIRSGHEIISLKKHVDDMYMAVSFAPNGEILVCYRNLLIVRQNWHSGRIIDRFYAIPEGDPSTDAGLTAAAFNNEGTKVVVNVRKRAAVLWDLSTKRPIARCVPKEQLAFSNNEVVQAVEKIAWHPNGVNIFLLFHNTTLVDWNPMENEKYKTYTGAKNFKCSPCGSFLITNDNSGTVKVFSLPDYHQIYSLDLKYGVKDIAFCPKGRRFYEVRETIISAWEPEALIPHEYADSEDEVRTSSGDSSHTAATSYSILKEASNSVTAIACAPDNSKLCYGMENGKIAIHDIKTGNRLADFGGHKSSVAIITMTWSPTGRWIASGDESGLVCIHRIDYPFRNMPTIKVTTKSSTRMRDGINQLLFSWDGLYLLISTPLRDSAYHVGEQEIRHSLENKATGRRWISMPQERDKIILIEADRLHMFDWDTLEHLAPQQGIKLIRFASELDEENCIGTENKNSEGKGKTVQGLLKQPSATQEVLEIDSLTQTADKVILEMIPKKAHENEGFRIRRIEWFDLSHLEKNYMDSDEFPHSIQLQASENPLTGDILRIIGTYCGRLVFFNHQYWICTSQIGGKRSRHQRHFFLPKDWVNSESILLCVLNNEGTLLYPRGSEVVIVKNGINF